MYRLFLRLRRHGLINSSSSSSRLLDIVDRKSRTVHFTSRKAARCCSSSDAASPASRRFAGASFQATDCTHRHRTAPATATFPTAAPSTVVSSSSSSSHKHKEKERKGAFGLSWFGLGKDDEDDRAKGEKESQRKREKHEKRERKEREKEEKEKEESSSSSFLGALFGKKKGHDEPSHHAPARPVNGQLTAGSLLERNEMAAQGKQGAYYYSRYPIHIERAVYRLSHIKLATLVDRCMSRCSFRISCSGT